jgi:hypothetical protein
VSAHDADPGHIRTAGLVDRNHEALSLLILPLESVGVVSEREKYNKPQGASINYSSSNVPMTNIGDVDGLARKSGPCKTIGATYSSIKKRDYPAMRMVIACGSF